MISVCVTIEQQPSKESEIAQNLHAGATRTQILRINSNAETMPNCGRKIKAPNYNRKTDKVLTSPS
jgi:hypothetical protein